MKSISEIEALLVDTINDVYQRPYLYGPTASEVDCRLDLLHWVYAHCRGEAQRLGDSKKLAGDADLRSYGSFWRAYYKGKPDYNENDAAAISYVVERWKQVSAALGVS